MLALRMANPHWDGVDFLSHISSCTAEDVFVARQICPTSMDHFEAFASLNPLQHVACLLSLLDVPDSIFCTPPHERFVFADDSRTPSTPPFGWLIDPLPLVEMFHESEPWDWDDELKVVPVIRPPFTPADYAQLVQRPDIRYLSVMASNDASVPTHNAWFFQTLVDLLRQPSLLAPGQWHTLTEVNHGLVWKKTIRALMEHLFVHGTMTEVFVGFRVIQYLLRRHHLFEDTGAPLLMLYKWKTKGERLPPQRRFLIFLTMFAASWNMWVWNQERAWGLFQMVSQRLPAAYPLESPALLKCVTLKFNWRARKVRVLPSAKRSNSSSMAIARTKKAKLA